MHFWKLMDVRIFVFYRIKYILENDWGTFYYGCL